MPILTVIMIINYVDRTVIGLRGKDGVVFAVEKLITSKLYEPTANKRIFTIDSHVGMVSWIRQITLFLLLIINSSNLLP